MSHHATRIFAGAFAAKTLTAAFVASLLLTGLAACDNKGKVEQAAEEIDEGVDTLKNGGKESTANKVDDAVDDVREGAKDATEELRK
jgi:type II secretory pathway predicted ATPase ExeA